MPSRRARQLAYTQEQATRWLSSLARGLQQQGQTIHLIEQLQPSWLKTRGQRAVYLVASRLLEGLSFAMIPALAFHWLTGATVREGLSFSLPFAALFALIDVLRLETDLVWRGTSRRLVAWQAAVIVIAAVLAVALVAQWLRQSEGLTFALLGLACGPAWASRSAPRDLTNDIQPLETMRWSWRGAWTGGVAAAIIAGLLLIAVIAIRAMPSVQDQANKFLEVLRLTAPVVALMSAIDAGLKHGVVEMKTIPNQGIRLSGRTAARIAGAVLLTGLIAGLLVWIFVDKDSRHVKLGLILGALCGLFLALLKGGLEVLRHGILRLILSWSGYAPWRLAAFLDYAADELHFLQRVGGGYMFIHRYLQEHFATVEQQAVSKASAS